MSALAGILSGLFKLLYWVKDVALGYWLARRGATIERQQEELAANRARIKRDAVLDEIERDVHGMSDRDLDDELRRVREERPGRR